MGLLARFGYSLVYALTRAGAGSSARNFAHIFESGSGVPGFKNAGSRSRRIVISGVDEATCGNFLCLPGAESTPACSDDEACSEPLYIPFKGSGKCLVEIVDV